jgi:hypothetical protein
MRRSLSALSVVIALTLATLGAFGSVPGGRSGDRRIPELASSRAVVANVVVAAPAELRAAPQRLLWALTTVMAAIVAALFGFAARRPKRVMRVVPSNAQVRLRGPPVLSRTVSFAL